MTGRLARLLPDAMTPEQRELHQRYSSGKRVPPASPFTLVAADGGLTGPPDAWLRAPALGRALGTFGGALRFEMDLPERSREIAILLTGFHRESPFELYAHRLAGRAAGLSDEEIEGLATRTVPASADAEERAVVATAVALLDRRTLDDDEYAAAIAALGERRLLELVVLVGWYESVATQLAVFDVHPPES